MNDQPIRLLIAEDDPGFQAALAALFESLEDVEVVGVASDGEEAVVAAMLLRPDVVTMDIAMPLLDGFAATRRITGCLPRTRVVLVSGSDHPRAGLRAHDVGADAFVSKSDVLTHLPQAVRLVHENEAAATTLRLAKPAPE